MRTIQREKFLAEMAMQGIGLNPQYGGDRDLCFIPPVHKFCVWEFEEEQTSGIVWLLKNLLECFAPTTSWRAYKRGGAWFSRSPGMEIDELIIARLSGTMDLPSACDDVLDFNSEEQAELLSLLFGFASFGRAVWDDIFVVTDSAAAILSVSHHNQAYVHFRTSEEALQFASEMTARNLPASWVTDSESNERD